MFKLLKFILLLGVALLGAGFASINPEPVVVHYYLGEISLPVGMLVLIVVGIGAVLGVLGSLLMILQLQSVNNRLRQQARLASEEVNNLRTIPLKDR